MEKLNFLIEAQKEIKNLENKINVLNEKGGVSKLFNLGRLEGKLEKLNEIQFQNIDNFLSNEHQKYQELINRNFALLKNQKIQFTVYSTGLALFGSHAKQLKGSIYPNGFSYSYSTKTNISFLPFDSMRYPSKLRGKVDYWGRLELKTVETGYAFLRRLPKKFIGSVDANGNIEIDNVENEFEWFDGKWTIGKLLAGHFNHDESKNEEFQHNKEQLLNIAHGYWDELKKKTL